MHRRRAVGWQVYGIALGDIYVPCACKAAIECNGYVYVQVPPTMRFVMDGEMPEYLLAKDLILQVRQLSVWRL